MDLLQHRNIEAKLVRELERDARASIQTLASRLDAPRALVAQHLTRLISSGSVRVFAAYDPGFLGHKVITHASLTVDRPALEVASAIARIEDAVLVSCTAGAVDIVVELRVSDAEEYQSAMSALRSTPGVSGVQAQRYTSILRGLFISRYDGTSTADRLDRSLIELLQRDGRRSYADLARSVNLTAPAVRARVQRLLSTGIITISAVEERGEAGRRASLGVGISLENDGLEAVTHLLTADHVEFAARCVGSFDMVATLAADSHRELVTHVDALRHLPGVRHVSTWMHLHVVKEDYYRHHG